MCHNIVTHQKWAVTPAHSTKDRIKNGGLYVTEISINQRNPCSHHQGTSTGCLLHTVAGAAAAPGAPTLTHNLNIQHNTR